LQFHISYGVFIFIDKCDIHYSSLTVLIEVIFDYRYTIPFAYTNFNKEFLEEKEMLNPLRKRKVRCCLFILKRKCKI